MKRLVVLLFIMAAALGAQSTTPNIQLVIPVTGAKNWDVYMDQNLQKIDQAIGGLQAPFQGAWLSTVTYTKGQTVSFGGSVYVSVVNNNLNQNPVANTSYWVVFTAGISTQGTSGTIQLGNGSGGIAVDAAFKFDTANRWMQAPKLRLIDESSTSGGNTGGGTLSVSGLTSTTNLAWSLEAITGVVPVVTGTVIPGGCLQKNSSGPGYTTTSSACGSGTGGGIADPGTNGILFRNALNGTRVSTAADILTVLGRTSILGSGTQLASITGTIIAGHGFVAASDGSLQDGGVLPSTTYTAPGSSTPVDLKVKAQDTRTVVDYGADRTGVADSTVGFNAAITAVASIGARLDIPCGTYLLSSTINLTGIKTSLLGGVESCVTFNYTGVTTGIKYLSSSGADSGEFGNFSLLMPNGVATTIGIEVAAQGSKLRNINIDSCAASIGIKVDNGTTTGSVAYLQNMNWVGVRANHCKVGVEIGVAAGVTPPTYFFVNYNTLDITVSPYPGQVGVQLDAQPLFNNNRVNVHCNPVNQTAMSGNFSCIQSAGQWDHNFITMNGEEAEVGGTGSPYSVIVLAGGTFANTEGYVDVRYYNGSGTWGAQIPFLNGGTGAVTFSEATQTGYGNPISLTNVSAAIPATTLLTIGSGGIFRVCGYAEPTTLSSAGNIIVSLVWNDGVYSVTSPLVVIDVTSATPNEHCSIVKAAPSSLVKYSTTFAGVTGSPVHNLNITSEQLQ